MKIKKCYISSFGKLKDFTVDFNDKLTVINHENGWGKTTLASFIKAIFYGLSDSKKSVAENERLKFKPWNSTERFGGYAIIERSGNEYKIERFFGSKASDDTVTVTDVNTGKVFSAVDLGKKFFQIDEEGFLSTTYFTQKDFEIKSNPSITAKYNETCSITDAEQFEKTVEALETEIKKYKMRGDKGLINDVKHEIRDLTEKIEEAKLCSRTVNSLKKEAETLSFETEKIKGEMDSVNEKIVIAGKRESTLLKKQAYAKLQREYDALSEEVKGAKKLLNGEFEKAQKAEHYYTCIKDLASLYVMEKGLISDVEQFASISKEKPVKKDSKPLLYGVCAGALAVASIILFFINYLVGLALLVPTLIFAVLTITSLQKKDKKSEKSEIEELALKKQADLMSCRELIEKNKKVLTEYLSCFNIEYQTFEDGIKKVETIYKKYQEDSKELTRVIKELEEIEKDKDIFIEFTITEDIINLKSLSSKLSTEYSDKINQLAQKKTRIATLEMESDKLREYEENLLDLKEKQKLYQKEFEIASLTVDYLKQADENMKTKYRAPLQNSLSKYIGYIAEQNLDANIDVDLKVSVNESGLSRDVDYYSKGLKNLVEICKRFALIEVLFTADKPFIMLDDPFVNLDDRKLNYALSLVKKLSDDYQIIYFICHDSRSAQ